MNKLLILFALILISKESTFAAAAAEEQGGESRLMTAVSCINLEEVDRLLIAEKVDVNARGARGSTALMRAMFCSDDRALALFDRLLAAEADVNAMNDLGSSALMMVIDCANRREDASRVTSLALLDRLLAAEADVNARRGTDGLTPLMIAVHGKNSEAVRRLLAAGADMEIVVDGKTAEKLAEEKKYSDIAELFPKQRKWNRIKQVALWAVSARRNVGGVAFPEAESSSSSSS